MQSSTRAEEALIELGQFLLEVVEDLGVMSSRRSDGDETDAGLDEAACEQGALPKGVCDRSVAEPLALLLDGEAVRASFDSTICAAR